MRSPKGLAIWGPGKVGPRKAENDSCGVVTWR